MLMIKMKNVDLEGCVRFIPLCHMTPTGINIFESRNHDTFKLHHMIHVTQLECSMVDAFGIEGCWKSCITQCLLDNSSLFNFLELVIRVPTVSCHFLIIYWLYEHPKGIHQDRTRIDYFLYLYIGLAFATIANHRSPPIRLHLDRGSQIFKRRTH